MRINKLNWIKLFERGVSRIRLYKTGMRYRKELYKEAGPLGESGTTYLYKRCTIFPFKIQEEKE